MVYRHRKSDITDGRYGAKNEVVDIRPVDRIIGCTECGTDMICKHYGTDDDHGRDAKGPITFEQAPRYCGVYTYTNSDGARVTAFGLFDAEDLVVCDKLPEDVERAAPVQGPNLKETNCHGNSHILDRYGYCKVCGHTGYTIDSQRA